MSQFEGKTVLVTGGGSGIGLASARQLADAGANVVIAGRRVDRLEAAMKEINAVDRVLAVPTNVASTGDLDALVARIRQRFGSLHGVFANAGVARFARTADVSEGDFDELIGVNLKGVYFTVLKALPLLNDGGSVVLNGSWLSYRGMGFSSLYSASKAAVLSLARTLASDLADRGIRINSISPGFIATEMFTSISATKEAQEACRSQVSLGRLGRPEDIADAVLFLLSPRASYITGQDLLVDGGLIKSIPL